MSETAESISQWQRYGADGFGYCVAFESSKLSGTLAVGDRRPKLLRMLYKKKLQHAEVRRAIEEFHRREPQVAREFRQAGEDWAKYRRIMLAMHLEQVAVVLKNPWFEDEKEWRSVLTVEERDRDSCVAFTARGAYLKPYTAAGCVKAKSGAPALLPIRKVICGPKLDNALALEPVRQLLRVKGYANVDVTQSSLATVWR